MKSLFTILLLCMAFEYSAEAAPTALKPEFTSKTALAKVPAADDATSATTRIIYDGPDNEAIKDLRQVLQGFKAGQITLEKTELGNRTGQDFYLARKGEKTYIKYTVSTSLENAIYTLLDGWGFHWYGPGENWLVKPAFISGKDIVGKWVAPTFRNRDFFGTGGLDLPEPTPRAFDPTNQYKTGWYAWKRRNRFNADFNGAGHAGQAFYQENKELLDKHPEWFNSDAGKQSGRLKIEIPEAVTAYKDWAKTKYSASTEPFINIGVDPEDGRGDADDPLPPDGFAGITKWNHADKWWWLANEVAKDYPENNSHIVVSMYAYGDGPTNALAPKFNLRKNVYPVIIPYAFQSAYSPTEMVKAWASHTQNKQGIYDYWNITQWSQGLPQFNIYGLKHKLTFWRANKIDGIYIETTDAAGPMGHSWWLAGQLQFDLDKDFGGLYKQYLTDCFGKAAPMIKKMYDRWSLNSQDAGEVSLSLADLQAAQTLVERNSPQWKRINELKAYVHFMKLYYAHDGTQESKDRLFEYLYSIHHLFMVQTAAFLGQWYISPLEKGNVTPAGMAKRLTPEEIDAQFRSDLQSDPKKYDVMNFEFDFAKASYTTPIDKSAWRFGRHPVAYFVPKKTGTISFDIGAENTDIPFSISTDNGIILNDKVGKSNFDYTETIDGRTWQMKKYSLKVQAGTNYYIQLKGGFNRFKMNSEVVVFTAHNADDFDNYAYPIHYLYVPKNCKEIVFESLGGPALAGAFYLIGAQPTKENFGVSIGIKDLYRVEVKPEWRGKVIACSFAHTGWSLKNLPNVFSLQPFEYAEQAKRSTPKSGSTP